MTFKHGYRERLAAIGAEIDRELESHMLAPEEKSTSNITQSIRRDVSDLRSRFVKEGFEDFFRVSDRYSASTKDPTAHEDYYQMKDFSIGDQSLFLSNLSESRLKVLFQSCCELGGSDVAELVLCEWRRRLTNSSDAHGTGCLLKCVQAGNSGGVELLLANGADMGAKTHAGESLLQVAVSVGSSQTVQALLNHIPPLKLREELIMENNEGASVFKMSESSSEEVRQVIEAHFLIALSMEGNEAYKRGCFSEAVGKYLEAIEVCSRKIDSSEKKSNLVKLEYNCARGLYRLGRWTESIVHCSRCLAFEPRYLNALSQRAQSHLALSAFEAARKDYDQLVNQIGDAEEQGNVRQLNEYRLKLVEVENILKTDHYSVLEIERFSSESEIKAAFRLQAKRFHPDKVMNESEDVRARSRNLFERMQTAYLALTSDARSKEEYDVHLRIQMSTEAVRESILQRRYSVGHASPPLPQKTYSKLRRSYDVLFRN